MAMCYIVVPGNKMSYVGIILGILLCPSVTKDS